MVLICISLLPSHLDIFHVTFFGEESKLNVPLGKSAP